jgi:hypothetical protein
MRPAGDETAVEAVGGSRRSGANESQVIQHAGKVVASVFWEGILSIEYIETFRAIAGEYYSILLD